MLLVLSNPKPGSASLVTTKTIVSPVTLELGLVLEENLIIAPHVETRLQPLQIMAVNTLREGDMF